MTTWQDISTAPRDGTRVDLWYPGRNDPPHEYGRVPCAYWRSEYDLGHWGDGTYFDDGKPYPCWWAENEWYDGADGPIEGEEPTHWMYPPAPPTV